MVICTSQLGLSSQSFEPTHKIGDQQKWKSYNIKMCSENKKRKEKERDERKRKYIQSYRHDDL